MTGPVSSEAYGAWEPTAYDPSKLAGTGPAQPGLYITAAEPRTCPRRTTRSRVRTRGLWRKRQAEELPTPLAAASEPTGSPHRDESMDVDASPSHLPPSDGHASQGCPSRERSLTARTRWCTMTSYYSLHYKVHAIETLRKYSVGGCSPSGFYALLFYYSEGLANFVFYASKKNVGNITNPSQDDSLHRGCSCAPDGFLNTLWNTPSILSALQENMRAIRAVLDRVEAIMIPRPSVPAASVSEAVEPRNSCAVRGIVRYRRLGTMLAHMLRGQELVEARLSIRLAVMAALLGKECERAARVIKAAVAKVLAKRE
ncbi:hypothetical protein EDB87DRAFT_1580968 [Lactarius vividus]|nr:hypothetical protein EDB87DRAFT_1580968 [Lactarius vividus]